MWTRTQSNRKYNLRFRNNLPPEPRVAFLIPTEAYRNVNFSFRGAALSARFAPSRVVILEVCDCVGRAFHVLHT